MSITDHYDHLGLRTGPSTDCDIQRWMAKYDIVTRTGVDTTGNWSHVTAAFGLTGWVETNRLTPRTMAVGRRCPRSTHRWPRPGTISTC